MRTTTERGYNFGAGPAMLPEPVLKKAQAALFNWQDSGMSILEVGHRTPIFMQLMENLEQLFRQTLEIPSNYKVLFVSAPARLQFSMVPMNLLQSGHAGAYLISGTWSKEAYLEASRLNNAYILNSSEQNGFTTLPSMEKKAIRKNTAYLYYTPNETIHGVQFQNRPEHFEVPWIADMTSCLLTEPINIQDYGLIFAGAQKNIGPAALTIVIVREDLIGLVDKTLPTLLNYNTYVTHHSMYATPAMFQCYMAYEMLLWIKTQGGLTALAAINREKAKRLYECIDASPLFDCPVDPSVRSHVNVRFALKNPDYQPDFLAKAKANHLYALQGHKSIGGLRASLYNAMPLSGVDALISLIQTYTPS